MDGQNQNPVQLPPAPLPINPQPVAPAAPVPPAAPTQPVAPPQPAQAQPLPPVRGLRTMLPGRLNGSWLITLVMTFVMAGGGGSYVLTHFHKSPPTANSTNAALTAAASADLQLWQPQLEAFYAQDKYYPADVTAPTLTALNIQISQATQTAPAGTSYQYVATPVGCTTAAKNCSGYTLSAVDDNTGKAVAAIHSRSGQLQ